MPKQVKDTVLNYDLNIRNGVHKFKLTFGDGEYRMIKYAELGGNIKGLGNIHIESLVEDVAAEMTATSEDAEEDFVTFTMKNANGEECLYEPSGDEDDWLETDLKTMLIAVEIVEYTKEK